MTFRDLAISPELLGALQTLGYNEPTDIQASVIPLLRRGRDVIGHSQTGTGKTLAYAVPAVEQTDAAAKTVQCLVIVPTHELALQVEACFNALSVNLPGLRTLSVYGGASIDAQTAGLNAGCQIVIGTPGRLCDHLRRGTLHLSDVKLLIIDEADQMLTMGFYEDLMTLIGAVSAPHTTGLFSATLSDAVHELAGQAMREPETVSVTHGKVALDAVEHLYFQVPAGYKPEALIRTIQFYDAPKVLVFTNTREAVSPVVATLLESGIRALGIHGEIRQADRARIMDRFRSGAVHVLVASDVAARGLDVDDVGLIINYDLPLDCETYIHRTGRTGRAGKAGRAVTFITGHNQVKELRRYASEIRHPIESRKIPTLAETVRQRQYTLLHRFAEYDAPAYEEKAAALIEKLSRRGLSQEDIARTAVALLLENQSGELNPDDVDVLTLAVAETRHTPQRTSSSRRGQKPRDYRPKERPAARKAAGERPKIRPAGYDRTAGNAEIPRHQRRKKKEP